MSNLRGFVIVALLLQAVAMGLEDGISSLSRCSCEGEGWWNVENIMQCQMVSDFLIALAYFSIPLELLYFLSCSNVFPFRWVIIQFGAFIVLCGLTHFINIWTYGPHSFQVMLALTVFKFLTALVSCATAITLVTLIPELLRVKVRELFLENKAKELDREVDIVKRQEEASWHVHMLTQEIRSSLDRHTILNTTLVSLAKTLHLENCTIWMPQADGTAMQLTHELKRRHLQVPLTVPTIDPDVGKINRSKTAIILKPDSALGNASNHHWSLAGPTAAIRMPLLKASNFKGGTPELVEASYAILVLVLPSEDERKWSSQELDIVEVVADQVAVALSHAAVLEESQKMRGPLVNQNKALQEARQDTMRASQARHSFQLAMNREMRVPMHAISALLSILQGDNLNHEQQAIVNMLAKSSSLLSTLINDIMDFSHLEDAALVLQLHPFQLPVMLKEAANLTKHMSRSKGLHLNFIIGDHMPDHVIGDEKRILRIILHMIGNAINCAKQGTISVRVCVEDRAEGWWDPNNPGWRPSPCGGFTYIRFEVRNSGSGDKGIDVPRFTKNILEDKSNSQKIIGGGLGFAICRKFVQLMHGNIWIEPDSEGADSIVTFLVRLQLQTSDGSNHWLSPDEQIRKSPLKGLKVLVADDNNVNRTVTRRLLERLGCQTTEAESGYQCYMTLLQSGSAFQVVLLDVCMHQMDGYEVAFRIREKFRPEIRPLVVALTASTDKETRDSRQVASLGVGDSMQLYFGLKDVDAVATTFDWFFWSLKEAKNKQMPVEPLALFGYRVAYLKVSLKEEHCLEEVVHMDWIHLQWMVPWVVRMTFLEVGDCLFPVAWICFRGSIHGHPGVAQRMP
eukprot:Gb_15384 [translate_table: standard]